MRYSTTKKPAGSFARFRRRVWTIGLLGTNAVAAVTASAAELRHNLLPTRYVEAPVEPAPPNAGFYPTRWNRWDSEQAYLPGIRKLQGPPVTPPPAAPTEELPPPNGSPAAPVPAQPAVPKRDGDTPPMPPAGTPNPTAPPTKPGELPPLPNADSPDPAPREEIPPIPNSGLTIPPPATPDLLRTPPAVDPSGIKPPLEQPREQQPEVEPRKVPEPAPLPLPAPDLKIPSSQPEKEPEKKEPEDKLFEAPPRSGPKEDKQGSVLPERPSFVVSQARGQWVAKGGARPSQKLKTPAAVLEGSDLKVMGCSAGGQCIESHVGRPAPLPANDNAIPLTSIRPVRDVSVRPVNWTEPASDNQTLPNPLRQR